MTPDEDKRVINVITAVLILVGWAFIAGAIGSASSEAVGLGVFGGGVVGLAAVIWSRSQ
jgi:hypothetical protein